MNNQEDRFQGIEDEDLQNGARALEERLQGMSEFAAVQFGVWVRLDTPNLLQVTVRIPTSTRDEFLNFPSQFIDEISSYTMPLDSSTHNVEEARSRRRNLIYHAIDQINNVRQRRGR